jgi:hypothetical protein
MKTLARFWSYRKPPAADSRELRLHLSPDRPDDPGGSRQLCIGFGPDSYGLDYYGRRRELHCTVSRNSLAG